MLTSESQDEMRIDRESTISKALRSVFRTNSSRIGIAIILSIMVLVVFGPYIIPYSPYQLTNSANSPPSLDHLFGTDNRGRDLLSQMVWGAYSSLYIALLGAFSSVLVGFFAGVFGGFYSKLEGVLSGTTDVVLTFPILPIMLLVASLFVASSDLIAAMLTIFLWAPLARAVRAQVMLVKKLPFVEAAKSSGFSDLRIVWEIVVPMVGYLAIAYFIINITVGIILTTALEFLGVGDPNSVSWGSIFYWAQQYAFNSGDWWWILMPGLVISLLTTGFALVGFNFEEIMNPRLRK